MAEIIRMPKMSDTMEEGVIASWLKKEGDEVSYGDILAEVETDKATMELESYQDGVLLHIGVKEKEPVPVDGILAVIGEKGEDYQHVLNEENHDGGPADKEVVKDPSVPKTSLDTSNIDASIVRMPKMSDTMEDGLVAAWLKKVGDTIRSGDILAEVETDKATMELEAYEDGTLLHIGVEEGNTVAVDGVVAVIGEEGADYQALLEAEKSRGAVDKPSVEEKEGKKVGSPPTPTASQGSSSTKTQPTHTSSDNGRIKASPLAKKIAAEKGIDLSDVNGTGDGGRIVKRDVENFKPAVQPQKEESVLGETTTMVPKVVGEEYSEDVQLSQMRKAIAKRLSESKFSAPHFYLTMEIRMDKVVEARNSMNETSPVKISFNDIVVKATASAIRKHPDVNVSWAGGHLIKHDHIHIGVAVAIPDGLIVPVVKFADNKSMSHISAEIKELRQRATDKKLRPEEYQGDTFTISNLGMFGIEEFTAVINPPASCIMAVGRTKEAVIVENGQMRPGNVMKVTMSCDHRTVNGAVGAAFLKTFKEILEDPIRMLI